MTLILSFGVLILLVGEAIGTLTEKRWLNLEQETLAECIKRRGKSDSLQSDSCQYKQEDAMPVNNVTRRKIPLMIRSHSISIIKKNPAFSSILPKVGQLLGRGGGRLS